MKRILFSVVLLLLIAKSFSQTPALSKDYYLKKSKTQKTVGWAMLGGGLAMTSIGLIIANKKVNDDPFNAILDTGPIAVTLAGVGVALGSIPFFISSAKNARRAATISFENQKVLFPKQNVLALKVQPAITLKIGL